MLALYVPKHEKLRDDTSGLVRCDAWADLYPANRLVYPLMIALEVKRNGKRLCTAGADDLAVLSAHITAVGKLGKKTVPVRPDETAAEVHYSVVGLTGRPDPKKDLHLRWKSVAPLRIGDVIEIRILETEKVDRATSRTKARKKRV